MRFGSNRRADRTNRRVLAALGLGLVVAACAGLTASYLTTTRDRAPIGASQRDWLIEYGTLVGLAALLFFGGVVLGSLIWLRRQLSPIPRADALMTSSDDGGRTIVAADALTTAIEGDLTDLRGVAAATAHFRAHDPNTVEVLLDVDDRASVERIATEASTEVLVRAQHALSRPTLRLALEVRPVALAAPPRVA